MLQSYNHSSAKGGGEAVGWQNLQLFKTRGPRVINEVMGGGREAAWIVYVTTCVVLMHGNLNL